MYSREVSSSSSLRYCFHHSRRRLSHRHRRRCQCHRFRRFHRRSPTVNFIAVNAVVVIVFYVIIFVVDAVVVLRVSFDDLSVQPVLVYCRARL